MSQKKKTDPILKKCQNSPLEDLLDGWQIFRQVYPSWISCREDSLSSLREISEYVEKVGRDLSISHLSSSCAGVVGGALAIAGLAAAPLTAGVSLGLTVGGAVTAAAAATTSLGATVVGHKITKDQCMEAEFCLVKDAEETRELEKIINVVRDSAETLDKCQIEVTTEQPGVVTGLSEGAQAAVGAGISAERIATVATKGVATAGNMAKVVRVAGIALNVAFVAADIAGIVWYSVSLAEKRKCDAAKVINEKIKELEEHRNSVAEMYITLDNLFGADQMKEKDKSLLTSEKELYY